PRAKVIDLDDEAWDDDEDDDDDDAGDRPARDNEPRKFTEKEMDDIWKGKGQIARMMQNTIRAVADLVRQGVDPNSDVIQRMMRDASIITIETPGYNPFCKSTEEEQREWHVFALFLMKVNWWSGEGAWHRIEWILQRQFPSVGEWLGSGGD